MLTFLNHSSWAPVVNGEIIKPSLMLLASRLAPSQHCDEDDDDTEPLDTVYENYHTEGGCASEDKIIIWLASNIAVKLSYTVAVSTTCNSIRLKYFGPLLTLKAHPRKLLAEGRAMILNYHQFMRMTENGQKHLVLHVIVHGDEY